MAIELATTDSLRALNDRAERLGCGRPFAMEMSPTAYLYALGGLTDMSLRDIEQRLGLSQNDANHDIENNNGLSTRTER